MESITREFSYGDNAVTFRDHNGIKFVNLTEMFKAFPGKYLSEWKRAKRTKELKKALEAKSSDTGISHITPEVMYALKGKFSDGQKEGTWAVEELALDAAMYLSVDFHIWVLSRIKELLSTGYTSVIESLQPQANAYQNMLLCEGTLSMAEVAKVTGAVGRNSLYKLLRDEKVLRKNNEPYQKYMDKYFETRLVSRNTRSGKMMIPKTIVTSKGVDFIRNLLIQKGYDLNKANELAASFREEYKEALTEIEALKGQIENAPKFFESPVHSMEVPVNLKSGAGQPARRKTFPIPGLGTLWVNKWPNGKVTLDRRRGGNDWHNFVTLSETEPKQYIKNLGFTAEYNYQEETFTLYRTKQMEKVA